MTVIDAIVGGSSFRAGFGSGDRLFGGRKKFWFGWGRLWRGLSVSVGVGAIRERLSGSEPSPSLSFHCCDFFSFYLAENAVIGCDWRIEGFRSDECVGEASSEWREENFQLKRDIRRHVHTGVRPSNEDCGPVLQLLGPYLYWATEYHQIKRESIFVGPIRGSHLLCYDKNSFVCADPKNKN